MISKISRITLVVGVVGCALTKFAGVEVLPMATWIGVAVVGGIATLIFGRPAD